MIRIIFEICWLSFLLNAFTCMEADLVNTFVSKAYLTHDLSLLLELFSNQDFVILNSRVRLLNFNTYLSRTIPFCME